MSRGLRTEESLRSAIETLRRRAREDRAEIVALRDRVDAIASIGMRDGLNSSPLPADDSPNASPPRVRNAGTAFARARLFFSRMFTR